ncbi:MAG TPA: alginate export family protein [Verrucomicrobiae bacterium]
MPSPPAAYDLLRNEEDYSSLGYTTNRLDIFGSVKYIQLRQDDPSWYLTFGGELRERFESTEARNFGIGAGSDSYLLQQATLLTDFHLGKRVRFFVEGVSGEMLGETETPPPVQQDPIDLQFAFVDVIPYLTDDERLTLRAGRFGMSYGAGRLVALREPVNIPFRFDGFEMFYSRPEWEATAFLTQPAKDSGHLDGEDHTTTFWGLYATHWFDAPHAFGADLYYFGIHRKNGAYASGTGDEHRHSLGTRQFGKWHNWDFDTEEIIQLGSFANDSIHAWTASLDSGYTWQTIGQPRLGLKADVTSGNNNSNDGRQETFDALYFKSGYFNDASLIRPENIIDLHPNASVQLTKKVSLDGGADWFWRYSRNDAVYAVPGFISIPALHTESSYVGTALDVNFNWQIQRHFSLQASFVHFLSGDYIREAGGRDVNYVSTTATFIF